MRGSGSILMGILIGGGWSGEGLVVGRRVGNWELCKG